MAVSSILEEPPVIKYSDSVSYSDNKLSRDEELGTITEFEKRAKNRFLRGRAKWENVALGDIGFTGNNEEETLNITDANTWEGKLARLKHLHTLLENK